MFRTDLWVAAFVRRHNDIGHICVVSRHGDPIAGQIFIELDHLNGTVSLYVPAPMSSRLDNPEDRVFALRLDHVGPLKVRERVLREQDFDPDLWVISLEMRGDDLGFEVIKEA
jgi:hypothetical protein